MKPLMSAKQKNWHWSLDVSMKRHGLCIYMMLHLLRMLFFDVWDSSSWITDHRLSAWVSTVHRLWVEEQVYIKGSARGSCTLLCWLLWTQAWLGVD